MKKWLLSMIAAIIVLSGASLTVHGERVLVSDAMTAQSYTDVTISSEALLYRLYVPESYSSDRSYSLLLFLHGADGRGNDNWLQIADSGHQRLIHRIINDETLRENFILVAPQCPSDKQWVDKPWGEGVYDLDQTPQSLPSRQVMSLLQKEITAKYSIDDDRIYISGLSMGGFGTWDLICRYPNYFAAAIPICGGADPSYAETIKHIPIWTFHSTNDQIVNCTGTEQMVKALTELGADITYTRTDEGTKNDAMGHSAWGPAYREESLLTWLTSKVRSSSSDSSNEMDSSHSVTLTESAEESLAASADDGAEANASVFWMIVAIAEALVIVVILFYKKRKKA